MERGVDFVAALDEEELAAIGPDLVPSRGVVGGVGASALLHALVLLVSAWVIPPLGVGAEEDVEASPERRIAQYLAAAAEREREAVQDPGTTTQVPGGLGAEGQRASGEEGSQGSSAERRSGARRGVAGSRVEIDPVVARVAALEEASRFGMIGLLHVGQGGDPLAPRAPWGEIDSDGRDALSARGNVWGSSLGAAVGNEALGLTGVGEGGGGRGQGLGLGSISTLGYGVGCACGEGDGTAGRLGGKHDARAPKLRAGATSVSGGLPSDVVARVVRQSFGRFRACYDDGLRRNPSLAGRVELRFVITRDGAVTHSTAGATDLSDPAVVSCLTAAVRGLSFPAPTGGLATVTHPLVLAP